MEWGARTMGCNLVDGSLDALRNIAYVKIECVESRTVLMGQAYGAIECFDACEEAHETTGGKTDELCVNVQ